MTAIHRPGYQRRDSKVVDYAEYQLGTSGLYFRGPEPSASPDARQITFIGAAQTYGCFAQEPFPALVAQQLDRPFRNFGYGGAGPRFFLENPELLEEANRGAAVVVQVMSARSEDNRLFRSGGLEYLTRRADGGRLSAGSAYRGLVEGFDPLTHRPVGRLARRVRARAQRPRLARLVAETQRNWIASYRELFDAIRVPTLLLWFSTRDPAAHEVRLRTLQGLFGEFPQLVTEPMVEAIRPLASAYISVVSRSGLPQPLYDRSDGTPTTIDPARDRADLGGEIWTHNRYYPSPQMHVLAARAVADALASLLPPTERPGGTYGTSDTS